MSWDDQDKDPNRKDDDLSKEFGTPIDHLIRTINKAMGGKNNKHNSNNAAAYSLGLIFAVLIGIWVLSGIFIVSPAERAAITRFGKYTKTVGPGPHWVPRFIENYYTVNVQQIVPYTYTAEMLTKDENIVSVAVSVQYRVNDLRDYLFNVVKPRISLQQATASAMRQVIGNTILNEALTTGRGKVRDEVASQLRKTLELYSPGIEITDVTLQPVKPPEPVTPAFDDAIKAREDQQRYINKAQAYAKQVVAQAEGKSSRITQEANAYSKQVVLGAQADVAQYLAVLPIFEKAPKVTRERMYLGAMQTVFTNTSKIFVDVKGGNNILYLPLEKILEQRSIKEVTPKATTNGFDYTAQEAY